MSDNTINSINVYLCEVCMFSVEESHLWREKLHNKYPFLCSMVQLHSALRQSNKILHAIDMPPEEQYTLCLSVFNNVPLSGLSGDQVQELLEFRSLRPRGTMTGDDLAGIENLQQLSAWLENPQSELERLRVRGFWRSLIRWQRIGFDEEEDLQLKSSDEDGPLKKRSRCNIERSASVVDSTTTPTSTISSCCTTTTSTYSDSSCENDSAANNTPSLGELHDIPRKSRTVTTVSDVTFGEPGTIIKASPHTEQTPDFLLVESNSAAVVSRNKAPTPPPTELLEQQSAPSATGGTTSSGGNADNHLCASPSVAGVEHQPTDDVRRRKRGRNGQYKPESALQSDATEMLVSESDTSGDDSDWIEQQLDALRGLQTNYGSTTSSSATRSHTTCMYTASSVLVFSASRDDHNDDDNDDDDDDDDDDDGEPLKSKFDVDEEQGEEGGDFHTCSSDAPPISANEHLFSQIVASATWSEGTVGDNDGNEDEGGEKVIRRRSDRLSAAHVTADKSKIAQSRPLKTLTSAKTEKKKHAALHGIFKVLEADRSSDSVRRFMEEGFVPKFMDLCRDAPPSFMDTLCGIAFQMATYAPARDDLLARGIMNWFVERYDKTPLTVRGRETRIWIVVAAGNLCLGEIRPSEEYVLLVLPIFRKALADEALNIRVETCVALSSIEPRKGTVDSMFAQGFHIDLVHLILLHNVENHSNALKVLAAMVTNTCKESNLGKLITDCPELFNLLKSYLDRPEQSNSTTTTSSSSRRRVSHDRRDEVAALRIVCSLSALVTVDVTQRLKDSGICAELPRIYKTRRGDTEVRALVARTFSQTFYLAPGELLVKVMKQGGARVIASALNDLRRDANSMANILDGLLAAKDTSSREAWKKLVILFHGHNVWESVRKLRRHTSEKVKERADGIDLFEVRKICSKYQVGAKKK